MNSKHPIITTILLVVMPTIISVAVLLGIVFGFLALLDSSPRIAEVILVIVMWILVGALTFMTKFFLKIKE